MGSYDDYNGNDEEDDYYKTGYKFSRLLYIFPRHKEEVVCWFEQIKEENNLYYFFTYEHLELLKKIVIDFLDTAHAKNVDIMMDKESLQYMHTMIPIHLKKTLLHSYQYIVMKAKDYSTYDVFRYRFRENVQQSCKFECLLYGTDYQFEQEGGVYVEDERILCESKMEGRKDIQSIKSIAKQFVTMRANVEKRIDLFLKETCLVKFYHDDAPLLIDKVDKILEWLDERFRDYGIMICMQIEVDDHLLKQFFTTDTYKLEDVLTLLTKHTWFNTVIDPFEKRIVELSCIELDVKSHILTRQLRDNPEVFTNINDLKDFDKRCGTNGHLLIDVCYMTQNGNPLTMTVFDKPGFAKMQSLADAKKILVSELGEIENNNKMRPRPNRTGTSSKTKVATFFSSDFVKKQLPIIIDEETVKYIATRVDVIADEETAVYGAWKTMQGCLDLLISKASDVFRQKKGEERGSFLNDIRLTTESIPVNDVNAKSMKKMMMSDEVNKHALSQCIEKKVRVDVFSIKINDDVLSRCIVPCVSNHYYYVNNGTIINNNEYTIVNNNNNNDNKNKKVIDKKNKRHRKDDPLLFEKIKRIRITKEGGDCDENGIPYFIPTSKEMSGDVFADNSVCEICIVSKPLKNFIKYYNSCDETHKVRNICHCCMKKYYRLNK